MVPGTVVALNPPGTVFYHLKKAITDKCPGMAIIQLIFISSYYGFYPYF